MKTSILSNQEVLSRLWKRTRLSGGVLANEKLTHGEWESEIRLLELHGKGMEETMRYLYMHQPAFADFMAWLQPAGDDEQAEERITEDVLTAQDLAFWQENGYIVVRNAVTPQQAAEAADAIWQYLDASPADTDSWYKPHEDMRGLMLTYYHHPALLANRRSPRVRRAYEQLYGSTDIVRNVDKVSFNPPEIPSFAFKGSALHWDVSLQLPIPFKMQGLLYLTDTPADAGAFHCVPGFHHKIGDWLNSLPPTANPREIAPVSLQPVPVAGNAGDFIIWHQALPHCATANRGATPRLVQYFTYRLPAITDQEVWI